MATWLDDILSAFGNLGGTAKYIDLYAELKRIRSASLPPTDWTPTVREKIERNSSDSKAGPPRGAANDLFYHLGKGHWGLRGHVIRTPAADDSLDKDGPGRIPTQVYRILRDTDLARTLKVLHDNECQICGETLLLPGDVRYSEAHHIQPLGSPHNGPDVAGNIVVLCPNHHALCDFGALTLSLGALRMHPQHEIDTRFLDYHNTKIAGNLPHSLKPAVGV
jgi:hypothetical protein